MSGGLYSLTFAQARWLMAARDTVGGAYVGVAAGKEPCELVDGGAATWREVRQISGTRSSNDSRPCGWTDHYLVPTELGMHLLDAAQVRE